MESKVIGVGESEGDPLGFSGKANPSKIHRFVRFGGGASRGDCTTGEEMEGCAVGRLRVLLGLF